MNWKNSNILIISPEEWNHVWVSKHHYALELSKLGAIVWFLNPPGKTWTITKYNGNLIIISYRHPRGLNMLPSFINNILTKRIIQTINNFAGRKHWDIVWSFDPYRFQNLKLFNAKKTIYHQVDRHYIQLENKIINSCDLALSTSKDFAKHLGKLNKGCKLIGHGLSSSFKSMIYIA